MISRSEGPRTATSLAEAPTNAGYVREGVQQILDAGHRAARLTRQLLAFSRKQTLLPETTHLGEAVAALRDMLSRMIGEDIELVIHSVPDLWSVSVDPGQITQVIMNLAVNARDAMPRGGCLRIELTNVELPGREARDHAPCPPGSYVMLAVTDTGCGMEEAVRIRLFEPFFTTKDVGKGTGLGLAMVYGIVKQSGGDIHVRSAPGSGTTFQLYFPRIEGEDTTVAAEPGASRETRGERILLVEDEPAVRAIAARMLERQGYQVMVAGDGKEALRLVEEAAGPPDLLVTDVVLPGMSGAEVARELRRSRTAIKVLYISGYTDAVMADHGVLMPGTSFLAKPFTEGDLRSAVLAALGL